MSESNLSDRIKYSGEKLTNESVENRHCKTVNDKYSGIKPNKLDLEALKEALGLLPQKSEHFIGDVIETFLTPEQFLQAHGDDWMPLLGGEMFGTELAEILQTSNLPDVTGCFIRNFGGKSEQPGVKQTQGTSRDNLAIKFSGNITTSSANHAHSGFIANETINGSGSTSFTATSKLTYWVKEKTQLGGTKGSSVTGGNSDSQLNKRITWNKSSAPHTFGVSGSETHPINIGVNYFVKVK